MKHSQAYPNSSSVSYIEYDDETQILTIRYTPGTTYEYYKVPFATYSNALKAGSIGIYVAKEVKGKFEFKKV